MKPVAYSSSSICQLCEFVSTQTVQKSRLIRCNSSVAGIARRESRPQRYIPLLRRHERVPTRSSAYSRRWRSTRTAFTAEQLVKRQLQAVQDQIRGVLSTKPEATVSEQDALAALHKLESTARTLVGAPGSENKNGTTPASALLALDASTPEDTDIRNPPRHDILSHYRDTAAALISSYAHSIITHHGTFITPAILKTYVTIQALVGHPETLPQAFDLYASKPTPKANTPPTQYKHPNPNKASSAVPLSIADVALAAAIEKKDLSLALATIETTVCTPAFHRAKIIRQALPPLAGFALAPLAVYTLASQLSVYQDSMDSTMATNVAFAGILAYVGFTATIGMVAVTTANDQMDRVTWATGMPLRERWLREEERAALDMVAGAWGFREKWRRGEEEGRKWEQLREWIGRRGMVLDRVELMEGME